MTRIILLIIASLLLTPFGEAVKCYHCFESFYEGVIPKKLTGASYTDKFIRCDKNKNNWNSWDCPAAWPVCIIMYGQVDDHYEIVRTCGEKNFCSNHKPPANVKVDYCRECNTTLCNDYRTTPDFPVDGPLFTFNVNINLNVKKYTTASIGNDE